MGTLIILSQSVVVVSVSKSVSLREVVRRWSWNYPDSVYVGSVALVALDRAEDDDASTGGGFPLQCEVCSVLLCLSGSGDDVDEVGFREIGVLGDEGVEEQLFCGGSVLSILF